MEMIDKFMEAKKAASTKLEEGFVPQDERSYNEVYGSDKIDIDEAVKESKVGSFLNSLIKEEKKEEPKEEKIEESKKEFDIDKLSKEEVKDLLIKLIKKL